MSLDKAMAVALDIKNKFQKTAILLKILLEVYIKLLAIVL